MAGVEHGQTGAGYAVCGGLSIGVEGEHRIDCYAAQETDVRLVIKELDGNNSRTQV